MNPDLFFSVIIPLYNKKKFIERTLSSVLNQSYQNFEIVIVDDCSNDGSFEAISSFSDSKIKLFKTPKNSGPSFTRNLGIQKSTYDFLILFDADDVMAKNYLASLLWAISNFPEKLIFGSSYTHDISKLETTLEKDWQSYPKLAYQKQILNGNRLLTASSICFHKDVLSNVHLFDESLTISEDPEFFCRLSFQYEICYCRKKLIYYDNAHGEGLSTKKLQKLPDAYFQTMSQLIEKASNEIILKNYLFHVAMRVLFLLKRDSSSTQESSRLLSYSKSLSIYKRTILKLIQLIPSDIFRYAWKIRKGLLR